MGAIEKAVPDDRLSASRWRRFRSQQPHTFAEKVLWAIRQKLGGPAEHLAAGQR